LCQQLGENARLMDVLITQGLFRLTRHEYRLTRELAQRVLALAERGEYRAMLARAHALLGSVLSLGGEFERARQHLEAADTFGFGALLHLGQGGTLAHLLLVLGYPAAALRMSGELVATARRSSDPVSIAIAVFFDARNYLKLGDSRAVLERAEEMASITAQNGMALYLNLATVIRGWALAVSGRPEEGITDIIRAIAEGKILGGPITPSYAILADACERNRQPQEGLKAVSEALALAEQADERLVESELFRLKGEFLLMRVPSDAAQAERCFRIAVDIARRQASRFSELKASTSLARLLAQHGKRDEACAMLAQICGWFTEGFEFADLTDAKVLLEELGA
jgi:tetratricopeptide (TPR) repeat protein